MATTIGWFYWSKFISNLWWAYKTLTSVDGLMFSQKMRFVIRSIFLYSASAEWYEYLRKSHMYSCPDMLVNLIQQAHRPFYDHRIMANERVLLLINHHNSKLKLLGYKKNLDLIDQRRLDVCHIDSKNGEKYRIVLAVEDNKEGGLSLSLLSNEQTLISLTFTFNELATHKRLLIGCIQATSNETTEKLRHATHELYGIQPRILLINILRMLCSELGIEEIESIGSSNHVYLSFRYKRKKKIILKYDAVWELMGGRRKDNGNYDIPVAIPYKRIESYPSKKRSEHRHRNSLMENIKAQQSNFINPSIMTKQNSKLSLSQIEYIL